MSEAEFLKALGIDPDFVELGTVKIDIGRGRPPIVRWTGIFITEPEELADAIMAAQEAMMPCAACVVGKHDICQEDNCPCRLAGHQ